MAKKQELKISEARVLIFLDTANKAYKYKVEMSSKLSMDYGYLSKILNDMQQKEWIKRHRSLSMNKVFYELTKTGQNMLIKAMEVVNNE